MAIDALLTMQRQTTWEARRDTPEISPRSARDIAEIEVMAERPGGGMRSCRDELSDIDEVRSRRYLGDISATPAQVRHGAMVALKYAFAVRVDLLASLLPRAAPVLITALIDDDDDVRGAAAEALGAVVSHVPTILPDEVTRAHPPRVTKSRCDRHVSHTATCHAPPRVTPATCHRCRVCSVVYGNLSCRLTT